MGIVLTSPKFNNYKLQIVYTCEYVHSLVTLNVSSLNKKSEYNFFLNIVWSIENNKLKLK